MFIPFDVVRGGEEVNVVYRVDGEVLTATGFFDGWIRRIEADGEYHWRICLSGRNGASVSIRTKKIVGIERAKQEAV